MPWWLPLAISGGANILGSLFGPKPPSGQIDMPAMPGALKSFKPMDYGPMREMLYSQARQNLEAAFQSGQRKIGQAAAARGTYQSGLPSLGEAILRKGQQQQLGNLSTQLGAQAIQQRGSEYQNYLNRLLSAYAQQAQTARAQAGLQTQIGMQGQQDFLGGLGGLGENMGLLSMLLKFGQQGGGGMQFPPVPPVF